MSSTAWMTYLASLRDLHAVRAASVERGTHTEETLHARQQRLEALTAQVEAQETQIADLARGLGRPVRFTPVDATRPAQALPWDEAVADLESHLGMAESAADDARHFGHHPPLLPTWPAFARNGVVYAICSIPTIFINCALWLFYVGSDSGTSDQLTAAAWGCCFWPIAAVVLGIVLIRVGATPRMRPTPKNEFEKPKDLEVELNIPLGVTIALAMSAGSIALLWLTSSALGL